jgi:hypothetical protein
MICQILVGRFLRLRGKISVSDRLVCGFGNMTGGRSPKRKGNGFEREVVLRLQDLGLAAERIPLSGAAGGSFDHDVSCPVRGVDAKLECKRRARAFVGLDKMLGANYALVCRDDRSRTLVVMSLENFAGLAR